MTQDDPCGDVSHRDTRRFRKERHGARRTGIHLDHIYVLFPVEDKLDIIQTDDTDPAAQPHGIIDDLVLGFLLTLKVG